MGTSLKGLTQDIPLTLLAVLDRAERVFPTKRIRAWDGGEVVETTHGELAARARTLVTALHTLGVRAGVPIATLAYNTIDHVVLSLGLPCGGWVFHPLNPRLHVDDLVHILEDAGDEVLIAEHSMAELVAAIVDRCPQVTSVIWIDEAPAEGFLATRVASLSLPRLVAGVPAAEPVIGDEQQAAVIASTTGTTARPKLVVHSHRSMYLHLLSLAAADSLGAAEADVILAVGPLYHANGLNLPYAALAVGATLVLPGSCTDGAVLAELIESEAVTATITIPVVAQGLLPHLRGRDLRSLRRIIIGSSACPPHLLEALRDLTDPSVVLHGFGMTETQPPSLVNWQRSDDTRSPKDTATAVGIPCFGVSCRVVHEDGTEVSVDGDIGELQFRGPWMIGSYLGPHAVGTTTEDGWLRTGDLATVDRFSSVTIVDRSKDLIKSGGLWISSGRLESLLSGHPAVREVAVVARADDRWGERPVAVVVPQPGSTITHEDMHEHLIGSVAPWSIPDALVLADSLPRSSTDKIDKHRLRRMVEEEVHG